MPRLPIRPRAKRPDLRAGDILAWADAFRRRHGRWPFIAAGRIPETTDQTWAAVDQALRAGLRGLPGGDTLSRLLHRCRGARPRHLPPPLAVGQILDWADAHRERTGAWPGGHDRGPVAGAPKGTTWVAIELALARGTRGLPGGDTLARLLARRRGVRNRLAILDLAEAGVLAWADDHRRRTGAWPQYTDGPVAAAPGETWAAVDTALSRGSRGLPGGGSLRKLLARHRGVRNKSALPLLTPGRIRAWASAHRARTGAWPRVRSGPIPEAPGETWSGVNAALTAGARGLPGKSSLARLLRGRLDAGGR